MEIKSRSFNNNGNIPSRYTCDGENINPPLEIFNIPKNAKSLALVMDDPDAPNGTWVHWIFWNLPVSQSSIEEGIEPNNCIYGTNSFDKLEYGGPCPPFGSHRYFFKVYALDSELRVQEGATKEEVMNALGEHIIDKAELIGIYSKS
jgi:hypothetical protein